MKNGDTITFYADGMEYEAMIQDIRNNANKKLQIVLEVQEINSPDEDFKD